MINRIHKLDAAPEEENKLLWRGEGFSTFPRNVQKDETSERLRKVLYSMLYSTGILKNLRKE